MMIPTPVEIGTDLSLPESSFCTIFRPRFSRMAYLPTRRRFLKTAAATGAVFGIGDLSLLSRLPSVSAADAMLDSRRVRLEPEIEPLVRLLEETPRERL